MTADKLDEYRRRSREAEDQAQRALREEDRASWLRIAQSWLGLIPGSARSAGETFDDQERDRGTHQDVSKEQQ